MTGAQEALTGGGALEDAALCETGADYDGLGARGTIWQVMRAHLEARCLMPIEVIYGNRQLRQVLEQRAVIEAALGRIATLQGQLPGQDIRTRRASLQGAVEAVIKRANANETLLAASVPKHRSAVATWLSKTIDNAERAGPSLVRAALARDLAGLTSWSAKIDHLFGLVWQQLDQELKATVDEAIGDLLGSIAAVRELTGPRLTVGQTLCRLLELIQGNVTAAEVGPPSKIAGLSQLFRQNRLPVAREAVIERVRRQLAGPEPLNPTTAADAAQLRFMLNGLVNVDGVLGGARMAAALTQRFARRFDQGGAAGLRRAVTTISESLSDLPARVRYLAALADSEYLPMIADEIVVSLKAAVGNEMPVGQLLLRSADLALVRSQLSAASLAVAGCGLAEPVRGRLASQVDCVADEFIISGKLFEIQPEYEAQLPRQALRLTDLVAAELVRDARALVAVRTRLLAMMRTPGFEQELAGLRPGAGGIANEVERFRNMVERLRQLPDPGSAASTVTVSRAAAAPMVASDEYTRTVARVQPAPAGATMTIAAKPTPRRTAPPAQTQAPAPTVALPRAAASPPTVALPRAAARAAVKTAAPDDQATAINAATRSGDMTVLDRSDYAGDSSPVARGDGRCPNCFARRGGSTTCPDCGFQEGVTPYSPAHLPPGSWLYNRYRTGKLLGQGGFGATYIGWDDRLQIKVAVKEFFPVHLVARVPGGSGMTPHNADHGATFNKGIKRFLEEARTLARLRDIKEIVGVQDYFEDNGTAYLVMELLQGQTMKKYIATQGGKIEFRRALTIMTPIMRALHAVHGEGLVHRDISPDNIFITAGGARLLDFGAARESANEGGGALTVILKPGYAPPEQYFSDSKQGPWTDVYAVAASLYCAITGKPPADSAKRLQDDSLKMPSSLGVSLSPELEQVLMTALALRRQDRYLTMKAMMSALNQAVAG
ncbi:MAG: protein kinase [Rhodospirillaceae bacterium]